MIALFVKQAYAACGGTGIINPSIDYGGCEDGTIVFGQVIGTVIDVAFFVGIILAFVYLLMGGLRWITSSGDKAQLEKARDTITHAIVGLIILACSWAVMTLISNFLGLGFPKFNLPPLGGI